jgi:hypothetical protein
MLRAQEKLIVFSAVVMIIGSASLAEPALADSGRRFLESRLVKTLGSKDPALIERAARRLGLAGMADALDHPSRRRQVTVAVLKAVALVDRAWVLLPRIAKLMAHPGADRAMASMAAAAAIEVTEGMRQPDLEQTGETPSLARETGEMLLRVARSREVSLDVRVRAVMALAHLVDVAWWPEQAPLLALLSDGDPSIREAAVELYAASAPPPALQRLARLVVGDPSDRVARAAAVCVCARVERRGSQRELSVLRKARAYPRIRRLVESLDAGDDQLVDLARCLARSRAREDRRALAQLRRRSRHLRRLLRRGVFR